MVTSLSKQMSERSEITPLIAALTSNHNLIKRLSFVAYDYGISLIFIEDLVDDFVKKYDYKIDALLLDVSNIKLSSSCSYPWSNISLAYDLPIIALSSNNYEEERIIVSGLGATEFISLDTTDKVLAARIFRVLYRTRTHLFDIPLSYGDILIDKRRGFVLVRGEKRSIGPTEFNILCTFIEKPERVLTRDDIIREGFADEKKPAARSIDVYIFRLRQTLATAGSQCVIRTVSQRGYSIEKKI